ncbi:site-specific integrase [Neobacillus sp. PS3-12]|uniref:tyrosine-type recombinase/integrase n=1 Tax=Neobacillus sp. PS3-12 TaxID=3070677 RepID=UPI0027E064A1|nr:site-specific integrase [Neobacillus sp. PS3-12]WML52194.1 site-specific integrase [Neobacillus sp. PS3-12]
MTLAKDYRKQEIPPSTNIENSLVHEFILQFPVLSSNIKTYYVNILVDFFLFSGKEWTDLSVEQSQGYLEYLERVNTYKENSKSKLNKKVKIIFQFLSFLHKENVVDLEFVAPFKEYLDDQISSNSKSKPRMRKEETSREINLSEIISEFLVFLENSRYSCVGLYKKRIVLFQQFIESNGENINVFLEENKEKLLYEQIGKYENMLSSRVSREEITLATATIYLRTVQLFVKYLSSKSLVSKKYTIPIHLRGRAKRANEYVPKERIIELMNAIYDYSNHVIRDLSIFLIIVDTGCRPKEVCNLTLQDVDKIERTLSFECRKTERRKVKISSEVMEVIKDYQKIRSKYDPKTEHLFINCSGDTITSSYINIIFYQANQKAFGESLYTAKAFRHTYITNALEEHSFERVSNAIGHKDWKSTYYYYNRSNKRLLANTLNKSPL